MRDKRQLLIMLNLAFACGTAVAAIGDGESRYGNTKMAKASAAEETRAGTRSAQAERVRGAGENVCRGAVSTATALGETFRQMLDDIVPVMAQTGERLAREVEPKLKEIEPALKDAGERVRALVRKLEDSYLRTPPERESDK